MGRRMWYVRKQLSPVNGDFEPFWDIKRKFKIWLGKNYHNKYLESTSNLSHFVKQINVKTTR